MLTELATNQIILFVNFIHRASGIAVDNPEIGCIGVSFLSKNCLYAQI
jgi:hypothetical protein